MKKRRMKIFYMMAMSTVIATTGVTGTVGALRVSAAEIQMKSSVTYSMPLVVITVLNGFWKLVTTKI